MSLIAELKRRNVFRVGAAYAIVGWLLIEVASVIFPGLHLPDWTLTFLIVLVVAGFPLALIFAWAFELTPEGIKREAEVDRAESIPHATGRKLDFAIIGLLVIAVVFLVVDNYVLESKPEEAAITVDSIPATEAIEREKSIAVLPLANRSANEEDAFFVDGMHDDILTQISKIRALKVISRTSVMKYRNTTKNLKTIGQELGAATVLEGGVQRAGDRVRINVQLIDAATDEHLWADTYDRQLTAANIFTIQTAIATAIADALRATLSTDEQDRLATIPTENLAAYEAYLLGKQRLSKWTIVALTEAVDYFQQAIDLDPDFSLAYVGLADAYIQRFQIRGYPPGETLAKAKALIDKALELDDRLGAAYNTLGGIEEYELDFARAETAYQRAIELNPNYASAYDWYGYLLLKHLDRPQEALVLASKAVELDPLSGERINEVGHALVRLGQFEDALVQYEKAVELAPDFALGYQNIAEYFTFVSGELDSAVQWSRKSISVDPDSPGYPAFLALSYLDLGDLDRAEYWVERSTELGSEALWVHVAMVFFNLYRDDESVALDYAHRLIASKRNPNPAINVLRDHELRARHYTNARALFETNFPELLNDDPRIVHRNYRQAISLALVLLKTGEPERAELLLDRSLQHLEVHPRLGLNGFAIADVEIYALQGDKQKALSALRHAIDDGWRNHWWYYLKRDLNLESLHDEPEFQAMVAEIEADMAEQLARVREMERNGELEPIPEMPATKQ
jgi:TolB-like protein/Tfp pilus assembly protein PilF